MSELTPQKSFAAMSKMGGRTAVCGLTTLLAFSLGCSAPALAQGAGDIAPPTRDELAPSTLDQQARDSVTLTIDGQMERRACALDDPEYADLTIRLSSVTYTGSERAIDAGLERAHAGYLGRDLPVRALCDIRDRAAGLLEDAGYLAAVEIPPQSLGDGEAELAVVLGRLVAVRARGDTDGVEDILAGYLGRLVGQDVFNVSDAERYLLLANDLPGTDVRLSLRPAAGGQPGDLVGEIAVLRRNYLADFTIQNYGSQALGRYSALARGEVYNVTGMGDRTSLAVFTSLDFSEQQTLQIGHDFLVGTDGLRLGGQLTLGWTEPNTLPGFDVNSDTVFATLEATYPFIRKQQVSVWGSIGFDYLDQNVDLNGFALTRDRVRAAYVRANFETIDKDSVARRGGYSPYEPKARLIGEVELRKGLGVFGATDDCRADPLSCTTGGAVPPSRIEQDATPFYVRARLVGEYRPVPLWTLAFDLRGQVSGAPLPAFEEFSGGNYSIGRGYDPGALIGDSGIGTRLEVRYGSLRPDAPDDLVVQPYIFTDLARSWQEDPSASPLAPDSLWSAGGGMRFVRGSGLLGDFSVAFPLRDNGFTSVRDARALFTLTARLSPWRSQ